MIPEIFKTNELYKSPYKHLGGRNSMNEIFFIHNYYSWCNILENSFLNHLQENLCLNENPLSFLLSL